MFRCLIASLGLQGAMQVAHGLEILGIYQAAHDLCMAANFACPAWDESARLEDHAAFPAEWQGHTLDG